jgi:hypothetical protein
MKEQAGPGPEGLLFRGERGAMLRRRNFGRATSRPKTVVKAGLPVGFHLASGLTRSMGSRADRQRPSTFTGSSGVPGECHSVRHSPILGQ